MRHLSIAAALGVAMGLSGLAVAQTADPAGKGVPAPPPNPPMAASPMAGPTEISDGDYANKMAMGDMYEIAAGNLALQQSDNADVKKLAQTIVSDHTASSAELLEILGKTSASMGNKLDDKHQAMIDMLTPLKGAAFDTAYLDQQVAGHQEALALNQTYASTGGNNAMKALAEKVIPKIQMHLDMAMKLGGKAMTP